MRRERKYHLPAELLLVAELVEALLAGVHHQRVLPLPAGHGERSKPRRPNPAASPRRTRCLEWGPVLLHASGNDASRGVRTEESLVGAPGIAGGWRSGQLGTAAAASRRGEGMGLEEGCGAVQRFRRCLFVGVRYAQRAISDVEFIYFQGLIFRRVFCAHPLG